MPKPSDYEYKSEQDPGDGRLNALADEGWDHYASDRGRLYFRRLKQPAEDPNAPEQTLISTPTPARQFFQSPKPSDSKISSQTNYSKKNK